MIKIIFYYLVLLTVFSHQQNIKPLQTKTGEFPYVAFSFYNQKFGCTGFLGTEDKVILAAHCFPNETLHPEKAQVYAGVVDLSPVIFKPDPSTKKDPSLQERVGRRIIFHSRYKYPYTNDLACIFLDTPFQMTKLVQFAKISVARLPGLTNCTVIGFDKTSTGKRLMYTPPVSVVSKGNRCLFPVKGNNTLCLGTWKAVCLGDSGGPLVCNGNVHGVLSHTHAGPNGKKCGTAYEEYFTELPNEEEFLKKVYCNEAVSFQNFNLQTSIMCVIIFVLFSD